MSLDSLPQPATVADAPMHGPSSIPAPLAVDSSPPGAEDDTLASRQCGRCRAMFPGDPTLHPTALPEWWLCPPCRLALLGARAGDGAR